MHAWEKKNGFGDDDDDFNDDSNGKNGSKNLFV